MQLKKKPCLHAILVNCDTAKHEFANLANVTLVNAIMMNLFTMRLTKMGGLYIPSSCLDNVQMQAVIVRATQLHVVKRSFMMPAAFP